MIGSEAGSSRGALGEPERDFAVGAYAKFSAAIPAANGAGRQRGRDLLSVPMKFDFKKGIEGAEVGRADVDLIGGTAGRFRNHCFLPVVGAYYRLQDILR
jgi:hypothetical protein